MRLTFRQQVLVNRFKHAGYAIWSLLDHVGAVAIRAAGLLVLVAACWYTISHLVGSPISLGDAIDERDAARQSLTAESYSPEYQWSLLFSDYRWNNQLAEKAFPLPAQWRWREKLLKNAGYRKWSEERFRAAIESGVRLGIVGYSDRKLFLEERLDQEARYDLFKQVELVVELNDLTPGSGDE